jgi:hypothetical protein
MLHIRKCLPVLKQRIRGLLVRFPVFLAFARRRFLKKKNCTIYTYILLAFIFCLSFILLSHSTLPHVLIPYPILMPQSRTQQAMHGFGAPLGSSDHGAMLLQVLTKFSESYRASINGTLLSTAIMECFSHCMHNKYIFKKYFI